MKTTRRSTAQIAHVAWKNNEISRETMDAHVAMNVVETIEEHGPLPYPPMPRDVQSYVEARLSGLAQREAILARKNGEWVDIVTTVRWKNAGAMEDMIYWRDVLEKSGQMEPAQVIRAMLARHARHEIPVSLSAGIKVQKMDSEDRRRQLKEGA